MGSRRARDDDEEGDADFRRSFLAGIFSADSIDIRREALTHANACRCEGDPYVSLADLAGARPYLQRCFANMSVPALQAMLDVDVAALWGRGAAGLARYRQKGASAKRASSARER
jgi:hypothetical protein